MFFLLEDGDVASVGRAWTDLAEPDVFVTVTAGRSPFPVEDALALAEPVGRARPEVPCGSPLALRRLVVAADGEEVVVAGQGGAGVGS